MKPNGVQAARADISTNNASAAEEPIAIVGMSCRFPGDADDPDKFWELCCNGRSAWSEIPESRFNKEAFYHPVGEKRATTNVKGGHFLKQDLGEFDAAFFNVTAEMAATMDPQLRILLESVFEALENAGLPLEKIAGTRTSVFAAAFFRDYTENLMRDPQAFPSFIMTGNGSTMLSNRISHFFDFRGASMTVDTGCSTGLTALHQACQSLRAGDSDISIIGGANILLNPDIFVLFSSLGFLSPDGRSYAFDSRAAGYGRGEGVSTIILKPLQQALKDGDPVRAVIRQVTLNQDGKTQTITSPSRSAQEDLIRTSYASVGLSPAKTPYVEAHGTGTPAGDPIEARAIGTVFSEGRSFDEPLLMGSVKTNIGHLESVSGFASILKVAMALETGSIPPSINFQKPNPEIDFMNLRLKVPQQLEQWPAGTIRRASISNFGYGGTNAHVIMEDFESWRNSTKDQSSLTGLLNGAVNGMHSRPNESVNEFLIKDKRNGVELNGASSSYEIGVGGCASNTQISNHPGRNRVFILSAKEEGTVQLMMTNMHKYLDLSKSHNEESFLDSLAYTLSERRSRFPWSIAAVAKTTEGLKQLLGNSHLPGRASGRPRLGFVFTGQGAQWFGMGRELIQAYSVFRDSLYECDGYLKQFGSSWSLVEELTKGEKTSRVNDITISPPLCIAVQISLARLLASWDITPTAITSHSSGEVAAAFVAGAIDCHDAMAIVYARTPFLARLQEANGEARGGMMAVGLSREDSQQAISKLTMGRVDIAAVNSPSSVTVSGDMKAIEELERSLGEQKVFARRLMVAVAFHSHHMVALQGKYLTAVREGTQHIGVIGNFLYASPVTGKRMSSGSQIPPEHWVNNTLCTVEFLDAFRSICLPEAPKGNDKDVDVIIEIGPHGALAGPIRQILSQPDLKDKNIAYGSCLTRGKDAVETMQQLVCSLSSKGYPVNLAAVNFPSPSAPPIVLHNLPNYPWNHRTTHWVESQLNRSHRFKAHAQHDLLGSLMVGINDVNPTWRHIIRPAEIPWIRDHRVQGDMVYPGAGLVVMAIEAIRQITEQQDVQTSGYELRNIDIKTALVIPDTSEGVEVQLTLRPCSEKMLEKDWNEFSICSNIEQTSWLEHCKGLIRAVKGGKDHASTWNDFASGHQLSSRFELEPAAYPTTVSSKEVFKALRAVGVAHGPAFQNLTAISAGVNRCATTLQIADTAILMPGRHEYGHLIHPTTFDSIVQGPYASLPGAGSKEKSAIVPKFIKYLCISSQIAHDPGRHIISYATLDHHNPQGFGASVLAFADEGNQTEPVLEIDGLLYQALGTAGSKENDIEANKCLALRWEYDLSIPDPKGLNGLLEFPPDPISRAVEERLRRGVLCIISDTLGSLTAEDVEDLSWYHRRFYEWMKLQIEPMLKDFKSIHHIKETNETIFEEIGETIDGQMVARIGKQLLPILRQEVAPLELMLEDQLLYNYYKGALRIDRSYVQVNKLIKLFRHKTPHGNILEIGGGTGGCTECVLRGLGGGSTGDTAQFAHYDFTDISAGFFEQARERFAAWGDLISYKKLDIEHDLTPQDFEGGSYDLIVACQVLHATRSIMATLTNVRKLLKPGGKVIIVETTNDVLDIPLIFGTLPGWWISEEKERKNSPLLTVDIWDELLRSAGFNGLDVAAQDCEDSSYVMSTLLSTANSTVISTYPESVVICCDDGLRPPEQWLGELRHALEKSTISASELQTLNRVDTCDKICIFIDDKEQSILAQPSLSEFNALKDAFLRARGVLWISSQATGDCQNPKAALSTGFLRTLRVEDNSKRYITLDIDDEEAWTAEAIQSIVKTYTTAFDCSSDLSLLDSEFALSDQLLKVPRLYEVSATTQSLKLETSQSALQSFHQPDRGLRMSIQTPGMMDSLCWSDDPEATMSLPDGWIEIKPRAFGLNFRDVMVAMDQLDTKVMGFECSGTITRLGPGVPQTLMVGSRVCSVMFGHFANHIRVHWTSVSRMPDTMTFETGASIPIIFLTAYHSIFDLACLRKGETILIHSAAGGVGQAAMMLAQDIGAEIYATAGSEEKKTFLHERYKIPYDHIFSSRSIAFSSKLMTMTKGKGVDVILNSLAGPLLQATWHSIAQFGRFVEIGKRDLEAGNFLEMSPFTRNVSFFSVDMIQIQQFRGAVISRALENILKMLSVGSIHPVAPITTFPIPDLEKALRWMQGGKHLGKIVITSTEEDRVTVSTYKVARLPGDVSYLIVGGVGGIGQSIAHRFVERGARNLILASRTAESPRHAGVLKLLAERGCKAIVKNCNICDESDVQRVVRECALMMPPIEGIVQAAMVLQDSVFENMQFEDYQAAVRPKVLGTWNLHQQSLSMNLQFFIMLSSVTGIAGNSSQSNYAAGNTFQDAIARYRTANGLPGLAIDLGSIKSVGYVSATAGVAAQLKRAGFTELEEDEMLRLVENGIITPCHTDVDASQVITGVSLGSGSNWETAGFKTNAIFSALQRTDDSSKGNKSFQTSAIDDLKVQLREASTWAEAVNLIGLAIIRKLADMFAIVDDTIETSAPLSQFGVDSLVAVELRNWLTSTTHAEASIFDIMQSSSILALATRVAKKSKLVEVRPEL